MSITRREFLMASAATVGTACLSNAICANELQAKPEGKPEAILKLSSQLGIIPGKDLGEKLANLEKWGFDGVELPGDVVGNEKKYEDAISKTTLKFSTVCGAKGGANGELVSEVAKKRAGAFEDLKRAITSAGALKLTGVIYVPAFVNQTKLGNQEIRQLLLDTLPALGEHAVKEGTRLLMEPLNRKEAFFLRQVADAASIARDCNSPGIGVMGDFYHMFLEETSDLGAFISGGSYVHHVHLASRLRDLPGQDDRQFIDGFRGLKWIGYQDFCSLECRVRGNPEVEIPKSVVFLRDQWAQAWKPRTQTQPGGDCS